MLFPHVDRPEIPPSFKRVKHQNAKLRNGGTVDSHAARFGGGPRTRVQLILALGAHEIASWTHAQRPEICSRLERQTPCTKLDGFRCVS